MKYSLDVIMTDAEGALERLLGRLRQRGFAMCTMSAGSSQLHNSVRARITIEGTRPVEPLVKRSGVGLRSVPMALVSDQ